MFDSLLLQLEIIQALAFREQSSRIRKSQFGAIGLLFEPLLGVAAWLIIRVVIRANGSLWMNPVLQYGSGFILFYLFSKIALRAVDGVNRAKSLLTIRRVRPLDVMMAGTLVEIQIYATCLVVMIIGVWIYQWQLDVADPGGAAIVFILLVLVSFGVGLSALVIGHRIPAVKLLVKLVIKRILFWTSGLFFTVAIIPEFAKPLMLWNPLLHGIELFRHALNPLYPIPEISMEYLVCWAIASTAVGVLAYGQNEKLLISDQEAKE